MENNNNIFMLCRYLKDKEIYYKIRQNISNIRYLKEDLNMNSDIIVFYCSECKKIFYSKINTNSFDLLIQNNITSSILMSSFIIIKINYEK